VADRVNFAVIGCGSLAQAQHLPNIARSSKARLHTCCDVSDETLKICKEKFQPQRVTRSFQEAVSHPQVRAICLATTEKLRLPVIELAAELRKPIYVEKPLSQNLQELFQIQKVVNDAGIAFCVGHNRRCSPAIVDAHRIFRSHMENPGPCRWRWDREADRPRLPEDGRASIALRINDDWYSWKGWVFDKAHAPHGPMIFEMSHFTDLCNWFLAAQPVQVSAMETGMLNHAVIIRYDTGELATISMCANGSFGYGKELYEMMGNGGFVAVDHMLEVRTAGISNAPSKLIYPMLEDRHPEIGREGGIDGWLKKKHRACEEAEAVGDPLLQFAAQPDRGHAHAIDSFVDEIRGLRPPVCGVDDSVLATRVCFAAVRSARENRVVDLQEIQPRALESAC
jgi:predicted dehydrogenase